ncbi:Septin-1 [Fukomys damarensis]|uniref:Septin-1 n=1 Tax=Fukomys damarensis TaxID=885580 RepID=A0A091DZ11_FUKDA|nr:Septin-1 [Fukomys damarensis]
MGRGAGTGAAALRLSLTDPWVQAPALLDVAFLQAVHKKVNVIPVVGKIRDQLKEEEISIYQFPEYDSDEHEEFKRRDSEMKL